MDLGSESNALVIPSQSVFTDAGHAYVWAKSSHSFEKRSVKTGPRNDVETVVVSGLSEGDLVRRAALDPSTGAASR